MSAAPVETQPVVATNIDVAVAVLTEKVTQVIGDHERRITNLEQRQNGSGTRAASYVAPFIAGFAVLIALADKIRWN